MLHNVASRWEKPSTVELVAIQLTCCLWQIYPGILQQLSGGAGVKRHLLHGIVNSREDRMNQGEDEQGDHEMVIS